MRIQPKRVRVFPNPFAAMDAQGRPCGLCPSDPDEGGEPGRFVGAHPVATFLGEEVKGEIRNRRQDTGYRFLDCSNSETRPFQLADELATKEPVSLVLTPYYRDRIADGSLIDAATVGDIKDHLLARAEAGVRLFNSHFDADQNAYELLVSERAARLAPAPEPAPVAVVKPAPGPEPTARSAKHTKNAPQENEQ